jgi:hypothetical protein
LIKKKTKNKPVLMDENLQMKPIRNFSEFFQEILHILVVAYLNKIILNQQYKEAKKVLKNPTLL